MRTSSLFALLLAGCAASPAPTSEPDPVSRPVVVFVHGRGQLGADTARLRAEWQQNLNASLTGLGLPRLDDDDVRLAWYADVLDPQAPNECSEPDKPVEEMGLADIARGFFSSLGDALSNEAGEQSRGLIGELLYFTDGSTRCAASRRLGRELRSARGPDANRPVIILAYSLGSLVTYDYLSSDSTDRIASPVQLVTLGSLLGSPEVRGILGIGSGTPALPAGVTTWVNVYDADDPFATPLGRPASAMDRMTQAARYGDPHDIAHYLRDAATGRAVGAALCAATGNRLSQVCARRQF